MKTKAAVLYEIGKPLVIEEVEIPELKEGQVLVKILYSGVCHSQLNEIKGLKGPDKYLPHLLGHEGSGIVEKIGGNVTKVAPGDYVALTWIQGEGINAGGSKYLHNGKEINAGAITTFSEKAVISENRLVKLNHKDTPPKIAALLGCAIHTGMGMVKNYLEEDESKTVAIYGVGGIGFSALVAAGLNNYSKIIAIDINDKKLEYALTLGATHIINSSKQNVLEEIKNITNGVGVDYVIESTGIIEVMQNAYYILARGGSAVIAGNAKGGLNFSIDPSGLNQGKKILGTWGGEKNPEKTESDKKILFYEEMYHKEKLPLDKLVLKDYRLDQINDAFSDLEKGQILFRALIDFT